MLGIFSRLGEIGVIAIDHLILVPMPQLAAHGGVVLLFRIVVFHSAFMLVVVFVHTGRMHFGSDESKLALVVEASQATG